MEVSDYTDPICPFDFSMWQKDAPVTPVSLPRILEKEDRLLDGNDSEGAARHLLYWLSEAESGNDIRGAFRIENELMGLFRKRGMKEEAYLHAQKALMLAEDERIGADSVGAATCYINAATVYKAFSEAEKGIPLFEKARRIYERDVDAGTDGRLGGLYNNMALALTDLGRCDEALSLYARAIELMTAIGGGELEAAVSHLNSCDALMARDAFFVNEKGESCAPEDPEASLAVPKETDEAIDRHLTRAWELLNREETRRDGYYAFCAEKCAPSFAYYGREKEAETLSERAKRIYGENR